MIYLSEHISFSNEHTCTLVLKKSVHNYNDLCSTSFSGMKAYTIKRYTNTIRILFKSTFQYNLP